MKRGTNNKILLAVFVLLACLTLNTFANGTIISVPGDYASIQDAVNAAVDGDTVLIHPGIYKENIAIIGKNIEITSTNPEDINIVQATIIDCNVPATKLSAGLSFSYSPKISGLTVYYCKISGLTIMGSKTEGIRISNAYSYQYYCDANISNCIIKNNKASGVYCNALKNVQILNCLIENNNSSGIVISDCNFLKIDKCKIIKNNTKYRGGGICVYYSPKNSQLPVPQRYEISNNIIFHNNASGSWSPDSSDGYGGGIYLGEKSSNPTPGPIIVFSSQQQSYLTSYTDNRFRVFINNNIIAFNAATQKGGGIYRTPYNNASYIYDYPTTCNNCTIVYNSSSFADDFNISANNCILWHNLGLDYTHWGTRNCYFEDPNFVIMPDDGGDGWGDKPWTWDIDEGANDNYNSDFHLRSDSPCIEAGYNRPSYPWCDYAEDIEGNPRIIGENVDIGAYEFREIIITKNPKEEAIWACGSKRNVEWVGSDVNKVDIELSRNAGQNWYKVVRNINNTGSFLMTIPNFIWSKDCMLRVVPVTGIAGYKIMPSEKFEIKPFWKEFRCSALWKSVGGDYDRDGQSDWFGAELKYQKWSFDVGGRINNGITIGKWGYIHIPTEDGILYTINPYGSFCWSFDANEALYSAASIGNDGTIYVGSESGRLYAISSWGDVRWTQDADDFIYSSPAVGKNDKVFYGSADGKIYAAGPDGSELWSFQTKGTKSEQGCVMASPSIGANGTVYITGTYDANMYALDPNTGSTKWVYEFKEGTKIFAAPVIGFDGTIYQVAVNDPYLYAIKPLDGSLKWKVNLADINVPDFNAIYNQYGQYSKTQYVYGLSEPVIDRNGTIYVSFDDNFLRAVRPNGTIKWIKDIGGTGGFTMTVDRFNRIYAASEDGWVACFDSSGNQLSKFTANKRFSTPVILWNNTLAVSDSNDCSAYKTGNKNSVTTISKYNNGN